ncbi:MAG TPA: 23S rRNA (guanosine(2251)-2'-O)-methyltransferase RlmB, partial [Betaproteobacteria bacterium]|nr:23S rRNA (guanosine(2251)-2'-O)-methyltransferase RlmB [Betaproteobacteria bacterium]
MREGGGVNTSQFIYGFHAVVGRLRQQADDVTVLYIDRGRRDPRVRDLLQLAAPHVIRILWVPRERLDGMVGNRNHQGVVAAVASHAAAPARDLGDILTSAGGDALLLVLDGVKDPHNVGACLRVADAFGAHAVVAPKDRAAPLTPAARKVASGAADTVPFVTVTNLAR